MKKLNRLTLFLLIFFIPSAIGILAFWPYHSLLVNSGETASTGKIANTLISNDTCLYARGTVRGSKADDFKPIQYKLLEPEVLIIGSSRSMQFRQRYFSKSSFTFGGAVSNIYDLERVTRQAISANKPEFIILALDYWWFNSTYLNGIKSKKVSLYKRFKDSLTTVFQPYVWALEGQIKFSVLKNIILNRSIQPECRMGMLSKAQHRGYTRDGSYFYGEEYGGQKESGFEGDIKEINDGIYRGGGNSNLVDNDRLMIFAETINRVKNSNIPYVIIFPPISPTVYAHLGKTDPQFIQFIDLVVSNVSKTSEHVFNFHDPKTINSSDCEFLDGDHGGNTTYIRVLNALTDSPVHSALNNETIMKDINLYAGRTISQTEMNKFIPHVVESDFLQLGCKK